MNRKPIRVAVNAIHAKTGGGVTYMRGVLPLLAEDGELEIHLFLHRDQYSTFANIDERIRIHLIDFKQTLPHSLVWEQFTLPILARALAADVLFSPANFGPLLAKSSVILLRNSLAVAEREARLLKRLYWVGLALATTLSILRSRLTIAVSRYAAEALTVGLPSRVRGKVRIIHHGVNPAFTTSPVERESFLLVVADLYVQKNVHTLLDAIKHLLPHLPDLRLKIAGRIVDQGYFSEIRRQIGALRIEQHIDFLGSVSQDQLIDLYRRCRFLVFPSTVETFGHPLIEAMACGTAIVSSRTAAMPEILGDAGVYFDPLDAEDMAARILELYRDDELRHALEKKGEGRVRAYSLKKTAQETGLVLKSAARAMPVRPL